MSWAQHDEWIDLEKAEHVRILRNRDTGAEHQIIYPFGIWKCPTCGAPKDTPAIDFDQHTQNILDQLNADHKARVALHLTKYKHVRLGKGPRK